MTGTKPRHQASGTKPLMRIEALDHFQIAAPSEQLSIVREFYIQVLGFREGARPSFTSRGHWLYSGGKPLVHLMVEETPAVDRVDAARSFCDHIAFSCDGLDEFVTRLTDSGISFSRDFVEDLGQDQIFLRDPLGVGVELNFSKANHR